MAVMIRLTRVGRHKRPFYRIVVIEKRSPRDGKFLEILGTFDPLKEPLAVQLNKDRAINWLGKGAKPSETVQTLFRKLGLFKKELSTAKG